MDIKEAIETMQDMLDVLESSGSCYVYKHNGGAERLRNVLDCLKSQRNECLLVPVTEHKPQKGTDYLCRCIIAGNNDFPFYLVLRYYLFDENPHFQHETEHGLQVTHWMTLPELQKEVQNENS